MTKIMTVWIGDDLNDEVNAVARADDVPVSEVIRAALSHYVAVRGSDPRFRDRLRELLEKDREVIERVAAVLTARPPLRCRSGLHSARSRPSGLRA